MAGDFFFFFKLVPFMFPLTKSQTEDGLYLRLKGYGQLEFC